MLILEVILGLLAALATVPVVVVFLQVLLALPPYQNRLLPPGRRPVMAVLVPAHNESSGIAATIDSIRPQLGASDRLLVVADNCTDDTAAVAARTGAEVIERRDSERRGKGHALDFGVRHLESEPPEVVIVIDADCQVEHGAIDVLARWCGRIGRPVQALYLMHAPENGPLTVRTAEFAWVVKNWVRPLGSMRLRLPCQLMGTGMAFPWSVLRQAKLANAHIVEDMKLGIELAVAGAPVRFCPEALVTSQFPENARAAQSQRTRWEHGHLGMIVREFPRLLLMAGKRRDIELLALALDLAVPPLALLVALLTGVFGLALVGALTGLSLWPLWLALLALVMLSAAVLAAWWGWGRAVVPFFALVSAPLYVLVKLPLYLKFLTRRQKEWVRTERK